MNDPIILSYNGQSPTIDKNAWVAPGAVISGDTHMETQVLDRAVVGRQSLVAAGSVVREGTIIPAGELWAGAPAVKKRDLSEKEKTGLLENAAHYVGINRHYAGYR